MPYNLTIEKKRNVLWVTATGTRSLATVLAMSRDILAACVEYKVTKVLTDVRTLGERLSTIEAYKIVDQHFPTIRDRSVITHCAILDLKEFEDSYSFFEDLAVNRDFNLRIFSDPDEAVEWLQK
jgi:hypothetical protein